MGLFGIYYGMVGYRPGHGEVARGHDAGTCDAEVDVMGDQKGSYENQQRTRPGCWRQYLAAQVSK